MTYDREIQEMQRGGEHLVRGLKELILTLLNGEKPLGAIPQTVRDLQQQQQRQQRQAQRQGPEIG